jgi:SAM-dependent methyltransferase
MGIMLKNDKYFEVNRSLWNELTPIHEKSKLYDVAGFRKGKLTLTRVEREEVGDIRGKTLLHLQSHFGLDTLSWARLGAQVTGVDFSEKAIATARQLGAELNINARFICCNLYDLPKHLSKKFDVVFTSIGVLCWLPDLVRWAEIIARFLKKGGFFYIFEGHPCSMVFDDEHSQKEFRVSYPYFPSEKPMKLHVNGTYADRRACVSQKNDYEWTHSMSEILNALISAGLRLGYIHEFPFCPYQMLSFMTKHKDGYWYVKREGVNLPFAFSLKAWR